MSSSPPAAPATATSANEASTDENQQETSVEQKSTQETELREDDKEKGEGDKAAMADSVMDPSSTSSPPDVVDAPVPPPPPQKKLKIEASLKEEESEENKDGTIVTTIPLPADGAMLSPDGSTNKIHTTETGEEEEDGIKGGGGGDEDHHDHDDVDDEVQGEQEDEAFLADLPKNRFELELEFVQALASPAYWHFLSTYRDVVVSEVQVTTTAPSSSSSKKNKKGGGTTTTTTTTTSTAGPPLLQDPDFLNYLRYLYETWRQPEYARFLTYPHCLYFIRCMLGEHRVSINSDNNNHDGKKTKTSSKNKSDDNKNENDASNSSSNIVVSSDPELLAKEWTLPAFRNFVHQQQFLAWQHRHSSYYGRGTVVVPPLPGTVAGAAAEGGAQDAATTAGDNAAEVDGNDTLTDQQQQQDVDADGNLISMDHEGIDD